MPDPIPPFDWAQEQIDTQELREATAQLGRYIAWKANMPALTAHVLAADILNDGPESGVVSAARAARLLKEAEGPATFIVPEAAEPGGNRFVIGGLEEEAFPREGIQFQAMSYGPIRPDLEEAIRRAHRDRAVVTLEVGATRRVAEVPTDD